MDLHALLVDCALSEGFPLASTVDLDLALSASTASFKEHVKRYDHWISAGHAASMDYLVRGRDKRSNPRLLFPGAESILCVALPYPRVAAGSPLSEDGPRYARYLQGGDYHVEMAEKLERVMQHAQSRWETPLSWKVCVDTSALLERSWAALAGLGWIGKNTLLIHPKYGSYLFLAEVLINQKTGRAPAPMKNLCGNCRRCLNSCPTQALRKPNELDSNRCISYWTLEKRGALESSLEDRNKTGQWVAGCDICQEACPFNLKPVRQEEAAARQGYELPTNATSLKTWRDLLLETPDEYKVRVKNSAMKRIKPGQFSRNLAVSLTSSFTRGESWAHELMPLIRQRQNQETDLVARAEWDRCVEAATLDFRNTL